MAGVPGSQPADVASMAPTQDVVPEVSLKPQPQAPPSPADNPPAAPQASQGPSDDDIQAALAKHLQADQGPSDDDIQKVLKDHLEVPSDDQSLTAKALEYGGKALGYAGGLARTGLAAVAQSGQPDQKQDNPIVTSDDLVNALKGNAPTSDELMKRAGIPEGFALDTPVGKITGRNVGGFIADMATDPLGEFVSMAKDAPYIKTLLNSKAGLALDPTTAAGRLAQKVGQLIHDSAYSGVDAKMADKGKTALSEVLGDNAPTVASGKNVTQAVNDMLDTMGTTRQALYDRAAEKGVTIDMSHPLERAEAVINGQTGNHNEALRQSLTKILDDMKSNGKSSINDVSQWKTDLYQTIGTAMGKDNASLPVATRFRKALSLDLKDSIVGAGNAAEPGLGHAIDAVNDKWGTLLEANKLKNSGMQNPGLGKLGTAIDFMLLGSGNISSLVAKKAGELAISPEGKSAIGNALMKGAQSGVVDKVVRQGLVHANNDFNTPQGGQ